MKNYLSILFLLSSFLVLSQNPTSFRNGVIPGVKTTAEIQAIVSPKLGTQIFNSTTETIWVRQSSSWADTGVGGTVTGDVVTFDSSKANAVDVEIVDGDPSVDYKLLFDINGTGWGAETPTSTWGQIQGLLSDQTDLATALNNKISFSGANLGTSTFILGGSGNNIIAFSRLDNNTTYVMSKLKHEFSLGNDDDSVTSVYTMEPDKFTTDLTLAEVKAGGSGQFLTREAGDDLYAPAGSTGGSEENTDNQTLSYNDYGEISITGGNTITATRYRNITTFDLIDDGGGATYSPTAFGVSETYEFSDNVLGAVYVNPIVTGTPTGDLVFDLGASYEVGSTNWSIFDVFISNVNNTGDDYYLKAIKRTKVSSPDDIYKIMSVDASGKLVPFPAPLSFDTINLKLQYNFYPY
ncbi:structural protein [Cellulophaga phage phi47:1]|uniref:virion structural protein n=1 Tax=Cellulophaga phage phiSM TaxID=756280 RepID=UPI0002B78FAA|nr:virion structural protein [Cellulophaga phage phiSM]AGF91662.1 hypothetical protein CDPG_00058 [Cellulophaga phage phi47:1]AGO47739.1 structural protein [Cellulophaga phage phi3ST:2]AGO49247.1 structural protein [Cellulophaga phage phi38:2]AGO49327.1 structural protein [Cellulophaga phage phi3:1]AGH07755.1 hypothetical protein CEPG_00007 [Cellulophaga phage phiSM]